MRRKTACALASILIATAACAQRGESATVPFVGCPSDGQAGPIEAPTGKDLELPIKPELAKQLTYYATSEEFGVLAPRGWHCLHIYGSGGGALQVTQEQNDWTGLHGPAVQLTYRNGDGSGMYSVAEIVGRVFRPI